jgi:uncharacterized protein (TIGR03118 family)
VSTLRSFLAHTATSGLVLTVATACSTTPPADAPQADRAVAGNHYRQANLAANTADYHAQYTLPSLINAWGVAIRPSGAGGHFWVGAGGTSFEFVGDVTASPDSALHTLHQDALRHVDIPGADDDVSDSSTGKTTGVVFNPAPITADSFVVRDQSVNMDGTEQKLTGSARFMFATDSGKISGWTEQGANGRLVRRDGPAKEMFDGSSQGMAFFGLTLAPGDPNTLLAADFGENPQIRQFDKNWHLVSTKGFANPFATGDAVDPANPSTGKKTRPGDPAPFNITTIGDRVFVTYAITKSPEGQDNSAAFDPGEEDSLDKDQEASASYKPAKGKLAEFDKAGKLVRVFGDDERLNAPWGVAIAPADFGPLSGKVLVANFAGAGRILAFDDTTAEFVDYIRGEDGNPIAIEGIWGLLFGNGDTLGDRNALYFTAGPHEEEHGLFGSIRYRS